VTNGTAEHFAILWLAKYDVKINCAVFLSNALSGNF
jgi:hypothetical protein